MTSEPAPTRIDDLPAPLAAAGLDPADPDDAARLDVLRRLEDLSFAVMGFDAHLRERAGVNPTDFAAVGHLAHLGPLPVSRLGELLGLSSAATTAVVDRLEASGHAERIPDDLDRRRVLVTQTDHSRSLVEGDIGSLVARIAEHLRTLDESELRTVAAFCDAWLASFDG